AMFVEAVEGSDASGSDSAASNARPGATVTDVAALDEVVQAIRAAGTVALNVQTTGLAPMRVEIVGIGLATDPGTCWYVPVGHLEGEQLDWATVRDRLAPVMADASIKKWAHNAKFHQIVLERHGVDIEGLDFDSMIAAY